MKANIVNARESDKIAANRVERNFYKEIAAILPNGESLVIARFYQADASPLNRCCIWIHGDDMYARGAGKAGGYGYHKESESLERALNDAGIVLSESIGGRGDSATIDAIKAVARAVTRKRKIIIHKANG